MKKFFACFLILAIFGSVLFFIGWTQIRVQPNTVGVVVSKLSGVNKTPVRNGEFRYNPEFLLPTNAELKIFSLSPYTATKTVSGELPSSDFYSANSTYQFKYNFTFSYESHVTAENVISLLEKNVISSSDDLQNYQERISDAVIQDAVSYYLKRASENPDFILESVTIVDLFKACNFPDKYPDIEIDVIALTSSVIPDYELYHYIRKNMLSGLKTDDAASAENETENESASTEETL